MAREGDRRLRGPWAALVVTCVALLTASCVSASNDGQGGSSTAAPTLPLGTIEGFVLISGGPMNPTTGSQAVTSSPAPGVEFKIVGSGDGPSVSVRSDDTGRFRVDLPEGQYTLKCATPSEVTVVANQTVSADCELAVP